MSDIRFVSGVYMHSLQQLSTTVSENLAKGVKLKDLLPAIEQYSGDDWIQYRRFDENNFTRVPVFIDEQVEIRLLCWNKQMVSDLHDHPKDGCVLKVVEGSLVEELFSMKPFQLLQSSALTTGDLSYIDDQKGIHRILNQTDEPAVSLHFYVPPGYEPQLFDEEELRANT